MMSSAMPAALREIGFDQNIDQHVPLDTTFRDEVGRTVRLGDYFGKRPVVMVFAYYDCPMLCTQVINGLSSALGVLSLEPGKDFEIVTVSFNPHDTPATATAKKAVYLERYKRPGAGGGWHFLTGDQPSIERLTKAAGFRYAWDADTKQFAHPSGVIVLTPDGRLARYLFGIEYGPRDLRLAHRRGVGRQGRHAGRLAAALLLPLRPDDRPLRLRRSCARCGWPAPPRCCCSARSSWSMVRARAHERPATENRTNP